ncbi:delta-60 repeat domain-containing protein [Niabella defluvii]|nr:delta-60 repeat domain-containing protein [Niabella sp. I65]
MAAITGLAFIDNNGALQTTGSGSSLRPAFNIGVTGINGIINTAVFTSDNKVIAGGTFSAVNARGNISNITRFNATGSLDTLSYDIAGDGSLPKTVGPAFNGGFTGAVTKLFNTSAGVVAVGNFSDYNSILYESDQQLMHLM